MCVTVEYDFARLLKKLALAAMTISWLACGSTQPHEAAGAHTNTRGPLYRKVETKRSTHTFETIGEGPNRAWNLRQEIGRVYLAERDTSATGTVIADQVILTAGYMLPTQSKTGSLHGTFTVFLGTREKTSVFALDRYRRIDSVHPSRGPLGLVHTSESISQRLPHLRPAKWSDRVPRRGEQISRFGFDGMGCSRRYGMLTKMRLTTPAFDERWAYKRLIPLRCPRDPGAPLVFGVHGAIFAISNFQPEWADDVHGRPSDVNLEIQKQIRNWQGRSRR